MTKSLLDALTVHPLLSDGGMGTQLMARGLGPGVSGELWNIENPGAVRDIHACYRAAGCHMITTNTFQGTRTALAMHNLSDRTAEISRAAAANARAAATDAFVCGDVGPFGGFLEPMGETTPDELLSIFTEQLTALREGGADAAIIETMSDPHEVALAVKAAKQVAGWPVIATYAFQKSPGGFVTMMGSSPADALGAAVDAGADVVGANCGTALSLDDYVKLAEALVAAAGNTPVILQPNAGAPQGKDGQMVFPASPGEMAAYVPRFLSTGIRILGGCCGTTPDHLAAMATVMPR